MFWLLTHEFKNYFYFILLRRSPRRGPSHDSSATHSSLCGAALLGPENHQKRPPQPAWRKNSKRYSFPALQPGQIKKLFLKNVFFLLSRMECCSTFLRPTYFFTRAGAGARAGQKKTGAGAGQKSTGSATLTFSIQKSYKPLLFHMKKLQSITRCIFVLQNFK